MSKFKISHTFGMSIFSLCGVYVWIGGGICTIAFDNQRTFSAVRGLVISNRKGKQIFIWQIIWYVVCWLLWKSRYQLIFSAKKRRVRKGQPSFLEMDIKQIWFFICFCMLVQWSTVMSIFVTPVVTAVRGFLLWVGMFVWM